MKDECESCFGEPISVYTNSQAVEDGILVPVTGEPGTNRVTRAVLDQFTKSIGDKSLRITDITALMAAIRFMHRLTPDNGWRAGIYQGKKLWLIPNEVGGLTLMFPEDY